MPAVVIVALVLGNKTVTYKDGDEVPLHQTLLYLGEPEEVSEADAAHLGTIVYNMSLRTPPIQAKVIGSGYLGEDLEKMNLTESADLTKIRELFLLDPFVQDIFNRTNQHPNWISHISVDSFYKYGELVDFVGFGFWCGNKKESFDFSRSVILPSEV